jgi:4-amino-4-deoxy-L-arabinose transferase-like glycosyltransferase
MSGTSSDGLAPTVARPCARGAWREVEMLLLALLVVGLYFSRLTDLTIRGEESRWARVAQEMIESGDWIVPRQQGVPFPDRPPLNSWAMILAAKLTGQLNVIAIRLPAVLATLGVTLLIYVYGRNFLSRMGSLAAAAAYPTMAQVLQLGRLAESDSLLTLCLTAALFTWHYAYECRRNAALAWVGGLTLAALAGLAKGPQGPLYFAAITTIYLLLRGDRTFLFNRWLLAGIGTFVLIVAAWQVPFFLSVDASSVLAIWSEGGDVGNRFLYRGVGQALARWVSFPASVWACMLPWSWMLPLAATRWFRKNLGDARSMATFLATACLVALPTCWLPADSRPRHFMSLYPCLALLIGLTVERSWQSREQGFWQQSWDRYLVVGACLIVLAPLGLATARYVGNERSMELAREVSWTALAAYALAACAAALATLWSRSRRDLAHARVGILAVAAFMGCTHVAIAMTFQSRTANNPASAIVQIREMIPPGERLVSFGRVHHLFAYYFGQPIEMQKLVAGCWAPEDSDADYFCYLIDPSRPTPQIPFEWDPIAEVSCERAKASHVRTKVVVGRRRRDGDPQIEALAGEIPPVVRQAMIDPTPSDRATKRQ